MLGPRRRSRMMLFWSSFLELMRVMLFALSHVCGGSLGGAIVMRSLIVRLALLPLTFRLALRAYEYQAVLKRLKPKLDALGQRHAKNPVQLARATRELYAANGIGFAPKGTVVGALVQLPV